MMVECLRCVTDSVVFNKLCRRGLAGCQLTTSRGKAERISRERQSETED